MEELPWTEEEDESADHPYYNNIPGKMPPPGGFIDTRLTNQNATSEGSQVELRLLEFILDMWKEGENSALIGKNDILKTVICIDFIVCWGIWKKRKRLNFLTYCCFECLH